PFLQEIGRPERVVRVADPPEALAVAVVLPGDVIEPLVGDDAMAVHGGGLGDEAGALVVDETAGRVPDLAGRNLFVTTAFEEHVCPQCGSRLRRPARLEPGRCCCASSSLAFW